MLVHPGGPFWAKKDLGAWSIPKGLADEGEDLLAAAKREFLEETGMMIAGEFVDLGAHKQAGGKTIVAWACEGDFDPALVKSNTFAIEWPPHSGRMAEFPEVDRAAWYSIDEALEKINRGQRPIIAALAEKLGASC
jgi:predicted NUDIX family NTP pyrophosphohydrolase